MDVSFICAVDNSPEEKPIADKLKILLPFVRNQTNGNAIRKADSINENPKRYAIIGKFG